MNYICTYPDCDAEFDTSQKRGVHQFSAHERQRAAQTIVHGTKAGYQAHRRRHEASCSECKAAWRKYYAKKRSSS